MSNFTVQTACSCNHEGCLKLQNKTLSTCRGIHENKPIRRSSQLRPMLSNIDLSLSRSWWGNYALVSSGHIYPSRKSLAKLDTSCPRELRGYLSYAWGHSPYRQVRPQLGWSRSAYFNEYHSVHSMLLLKVWMKHWRLHAMIMIHESWPAFPVSASRG